MDSTVEFPELNSKVLKLIISLSRLCLTMIIKSKKLEFNRGVFKNLSNIYRELFCENS